MRTLRAQYLKALSLNEFPDYLLPKPDRASQLTEMLFLGQGAQATAVRVSEDKSMPYFPTLLSGTKKSEMMKLELEGELDSQVPPSETDESGLCDYRAVPSDWSKIKTDMPHHQMKEATIPPISTKLLREGYKLVEIISDLDRKIALNVLALMTRTRATHGVELSKKSSSSAPYYSKLPSLKKKELLHGLTFKTEIAHHIQKGQYSELWHKYWVCIYQHLVYRDQPDGWKDGKPKERFVTDLLYALTGGERGERFVADKVIEGSKLARARKRTAFATAGCVNKILSAIFQPYAKAAYTEFASTWKTTSAEHLKSKMSPYKYFVCSDTTAHDQIYSKAIFELLFEGLERVLKPEAIAVLESVVFAPYHLSSPYLGEKFDMWVGDPLDPRGFDNHLGLPSGLGPNSFIGRWWMTSFALMIIHRLTGDVIGQEEAYLKGQKDILLLNSADDMMFGFVNKSQHTTLLDALKAEQGPKKSEIIPPYMTMNLESPASFLGYVPYKDKAGDLQVTSNVVSFVVNRVSPERSIQSAARRHWALGLDAVLKQFGTAPEFSKVYTIFDNMLYKHGGLRYLQMIEQYGAKDVILAKMSSLSPADLELLDNPDKIHYKFDKHDISPQVYDDITLSIPFETVEPLREDWYL